MRERNVRCLSIVSLAVVLLCGGSVGAQSNLADVVAAAGAEPQTLSLPPGRYLVPWDLVLPSHLTVRVEPGAVIEIASGATLLFEATLEDCTYRIFEDANDDRSMGVKLAPGVVDYVRPEWWGARGDGDAQSALGNVVAIDKAMYSSGDSTYSPRVLFAVGQYYVDRTVVLKSGVFLEGLGNVRDESASTVLRLRDGANCHLVSDGVPETGDRNYGGGLTGIRFSGGSQTGAVDALHFSDKLRMFRIRGCGFAGFSGWAMHFEGVGRTMVEENWVDQCANGMYMYLFDSWVRNNDIHVTGEYGVQFHGFDTPFVGNRLDGKGSARVGLYFNGAPNANVRENLIERFEFGIHIYDGGGFVFHNTIRDNRRDGIFTDRASYNQGVFMHNSIVGNGTSGEGYGVNLTTFNFGQSDSWFAQNTIRDNGSGPVRVVATDGSGRFDDDLDGTAPLVENNDGADIGVAELPLLESDSVPRALSGRWFRTGNASPIALTGFNGVPNGKDFVIRFDDGVTSLKFSGNTRLRGNEGRDLTPAAGEYVQCSRVDDVFVCERFEGDCGNGQDDDGDGLVDCQDPSCAVWEEVSDGRDNDCDGQVDEALVGPTCRLQVGVCQGTTQQCGGVSGWTECDAASYGTDYETVEARCDGLDNDCDGEVDEYGCAGEGGAPGAGGAAGDGTAGVAGQGAVAGTEPEAGRDGGCGCRASRRAGREPWAMGLLILIGAVTMGRRRFSA